MADERRKLLLVWLRRVILKNDLQSRALELRESFASVIPGYHMNKKHWTTVILDGELSERQVRELADHSYSLVKASLPKALRPRKPSS